MTYKRIVRTIALVFCTCFLIAGCAPEEAVIIKPMEKEEVITYGFDFLGGQDVMPISGYNGPSPAYWSKEGNVSYDFITDEGFKKLADAGVNHISYVPWHFPASQEYATKMLELGEKYGIGITVRANLSYMETMEKTDAFLKQYSDYESFCSVFVTDEPSSANYFASNDRMISLYVKYFEHLNQLGYFPYCNLYPLYDAKQRDAYDEYLEEYMSTCKPPVLIYDHYVYDTDKFDNYFYNMSVIREKAEEYNVPWWGFVGCGSDWSTGDSFDVPTEYQFVWNINTYLAYGAKGIQYYPVIQNIGDIQTPQFEDGLTRIGLLGAYGAKTRFWNYAKQMNEQIAACDDVLMNSVNKGVLLTCDSAKTELADAKYVLDGSSWRELENVEGETMIGCFNYNGSSVFYVVNYSREYAQKITLDFVDSYKMSVVQNAKKSYVETDELTLDMLAGEGVLIVVE